MFVQQAFKPNELCLLPERTGRQKREQDLEEQPSASTLSLQDLWFNERSGTPMARLRTPVATVEMALNARHEGLGVRAAARVVGQSPSTITDWEERLSTHLPAWSPRAPEGGEVTIEGDELYTRVGENLSPLRVTGMDD